MNIEIYGGTHLADTLARAARIRGMAVESYNAELVFVAEDVYDHEDANFLIDKYMIAAGDNDRDYPIILVSQVPPGYTRTWGEKRADVFYQVDTIIMNNALERMVHPEQIIVGCLEPDKPLPLAYQEFLLAFRVPVIKMSYESAELAKLAINYFLTAQIKTTNTLSTVAKKIGADWNDVARALHNDKRIGRDAYLRPGEPNQHLNRDVSTIDGLYEELTRDG
jgi:UDPglucose 6-dehydrogenase